MSTTALLGSLSRALRKRSLEYIYLGVHLSDRMCLRLFQIITWMRQGHFLKWPNYLCQSLSQMICCPIYYVVNEILHISTEPAKTMNAYSHYYGLQVSHAMEAWMSSSL